jgi:hypothetical protein
MYFHDVSVVADVMNYPRMNCFEIDSDYDTECPALIVRAKHDTVLPIAQLSNE